MFTREALELLSNDKSAFDQVQCEEKDPNHPNHLQSKLKFAMCQIYGLGTPGNFVKGFDKIIDVLINGKEFSGAASKLWISLIKQVFSARELKGIFKYYNSRKVKNARTQTIIGFCYNYGIGVQNDTEEQKAQNQREAVRLYTEAAAQGYAPSQVNLGYCYENGIGVQNDTEEQKAQNQREAVRLYTEAAAQNYAPSQVKLGACYRKGIGVQNDTEEQKAQNQREAVRLYTEAAAQGYAEAQFNLGYCYLNGIGVENNTEEQKAQNQREAVRLYTEAAAQGYAEAQFRLGHCYQQSKCSEEVLNGIKFFPNAQSSREEVELWADTMNVLGEASAKRIIKTIHHEELSELLAKQGILNPPFLRFFEETQSRVLLTHIWGGSEYSTLGGFQFRLQGSHPALMHPELKKSVRHFTEKNIKKEWVEIFSQKYPALNGDEIFDILDKVKCDILKMQPVMQDMFSGIEQEKWIGSFPNEVIMFLPRTKTVGGGHVVGMGVYLNYCFYINRGYGSGDFRGASIYQFDDPKALMAVTEYARIRANTKDILAYIQKNAKCMHKIEMKNQLTGNCVWVAAKGNYLGALYFRAIEALQNKGLSPEDNRNIAEAFSVTFYKYFSIEWRQTSLEQYLSKNTGIEKDEVLLTNICTKVRFKGIQPEWQLRGGKPMLPFFNQKTVIQSDTAMIREFKKAMILKDFKKAETFLQLGIIKTAVLNEQIKSAISSRDLKSFEWLLNHGADVNAQVGQCSILFSALTTLPFSKNKEELEQSFHFIEELLKAGAKDQAYGNFEILSKTTMFSTEVAERVIAMVKQYEKPKNFCVSHNLY